MSGSGGGGDSWREQPKDTCETLSQETTLNSPVKAVVSKLKKGDKLDVRIKKSGNVTVVEALHNGKTAGAITSSIVTRLVECIGEGHKYVADVTDVNGGACKVHVHHT
jgi:cysteinyl-tRNA synthetase